MDNTSHCSRIIKLMYPYNSFQFRHTDLIAIICSVPDVNVVISIRSCYHLRISTLHYKIVNNPISLITVPVINQTSFRGFVISNYFYDVEYAHHEVFIDCNHLQEDQNFKVIREALP